MPVGLPGILPPVRDREAFLLVRIGWHGKDGGIQASVGKWSSSEVCGFLEEISIVKLKSWQ